jgi:hypothetical protein
MTIYEELMNLMFNLRQVHCEAGTWLELVQDRAQWKASLVSGVLKLEFFHRRIINL